MADENKFDMDAAYAALRPHQRALFDLLGITAVGAKKMVDGAVNAFDTTGKIVRGEPVTQDEVKRGAGDVAGVAMVGSMPFGRPAGAVGSGGGRRLDMSPEARIARAQKLGFDTDQTWLHATTHDFKAFDPKKMNPEGHLGQSIYLTNKAADANANYAGTHGPDLTNRIAERAEQLINEVHRSPLKWGSPEYDAAMAAAKERALMEIAGPHDGAILPLYARTKNVLDLTPEAKPTWIDLAPKMNRSGDIVADSPKMQAIDRALMRAESDGIYDLDRQRVLGDIGENAFDGIRARDLDKMLRESEGLMYATDGNTGQLMSSELIRRIWEALGYRGVKIDAREKFSNMKMPDDTQHLMMFKPQDLRSVNAAFSPSKKNSGDLLAARGGLPYVYGYTPPPPGEVY